MLLEAVDSEYYMFCDNDDVWTLDKVGTLIKTMHDKELQHPDIPILVHHDVTVCDENLNVIHDSLWKSINIKPWKFNTCL